MQEKNCKILNKNKRRKKSSNNINVKKFINLLNDQIGHEVYEIDENAMRGEADEEGDDEDEEQVEVDDEVSIASIDNTNHINRSESDDNNNDDNDNDKISIYESNTNHEITTINSKFEEIYDDIYEVVLPNTLWGLHRDPDRQFITFTYFDHTKMNATKIFYIDNKFCTKILLHNLEIINETVTDLSTEYLSNLLNDIDEYRICLDINKNEDQCQGVTMGNNDRCFECENKLN